MVGGGHVIRCLTLAAALAASGSRCSFLATPDVAMVLDRFAPAGLGRVAAGPADLIQAAAAAADGLAADLVVFDHYGFSQTAHRRVAGGRRTVVIDELANRPLAADLVVDTGPNRDPADYAGLAGPAARILTGPRYALVRPEFVALRESALARRGSEGAVRKVLVSMGLTDMGGITAQVVALLSAQPGRTVFEVVVDPDSPSRPALSAIARDDPRIRLIPLTRDLPRLMFEADAAVGAGGGATWERCTLGLPSLLVVLAENQRPSAHALKSLGAALVCDVQAPGFPLAFAQSFGRLRTDAALRADLGRRSAALCDGLGAERVARACLDLLG
jgi:UDP-2,4-diacetamido-2,4,6-trideoxy-beta-L-altropyranose hydrolase